MTNPYDELSDRARWFMENFDECGIAEICATNEAAAVRAQAAVSRVRKALDDAAWGGPDRADVIDEIRAALDQPQDPTTT